MFHRWFVLVVAVVGIPGICSALTLGGIEGMVVDKDRNARSGVRVSISSASLIGGMRRVVTDDLGRFKFSDLPPGSYSLQVGETPLPVRGDSIRVSLNRTVRITLTANTEDPTRAVSLETDGGALSRTDVSTLFDRQYLDRAAVGLSGRQTTALIDAAPGTAEGPNPSVLGGTAGDNVSMVDGMITSDPVFGTPAPFLPFDAISEISFVTATADVAYGFGTGGIINLVTKSGGNDFSGSLDFRYEDDSFSKDGDHFDADLMAESIRNISATLGGAIVRDRLWFFVAGEHQLIDQPAAGGIRETESRSYLVKGTWLPAADHRVTLMYSGDTKRLPHANASYYVDDSAAETRENGGYAVQADLASVLADSLFLTARMGMSRRSVDSLPGHGDASRSAHFDQMTGVLSNSTYYSNLDDRDRDQIDVSGTYFVDDLVGTHEFKAGLGRSSIDSGVRSWINGGGYFSDIDEPVGLTYVDLNGDGYYNGTVLIKEIEGTDLPAGVFDFEAIKNQRLQSSSDTNSFFLQDTWRPMSSLTIRPGVRYDGVELTNHIGERIADMDRWQPRLGMAWDVLGDGKNVVHGSWGQFIDPTALSIPNFAKGVSQIYHDYNTLEYYCNTLGLCTVDDLPSSWPAFEWTNAEGFTYTLVDNIGTSVYDPAQTLDQAGLGHLDAPYADEWVIGYERRLAPETSFGLTYVNKKTRKIIEDSCSSNSWIFGATDMPSLDDSDTWTRATECDFWMVANVPGIYRQYEAAIIDFDIRQENFHLLASYTWSESTGNTANGAAESYATGLADYYPVHFYNRDGLMPDHRAHRFKMSGYLLLPFDVTVGFDGFWSSAGRVTPTASCNALRNASEDEILAIGADPDAVAYCYTGDGYFLGSTDIYLRPRGAIETEDIWQLDLQVAKAFEIAGFEISALLAVYNVFDQESGLSFNEAAFNWYGTEVGQPLSWQPPRRFELGFRVEF